MNDYYQLCNKILSIGNRESNARTGQDTRVLFGESMTFCMEDYTLPVVTRKRVDLHNILTELNWFLSGSTNIKPLQDQDVNIWNEWADENGDLGPVYGKQWTDFGGVDQISRLIRGLIDNPSCRRHIVSAWNVAELSEMALPPCHLMFQCHVRDGMWLDMQMYQRSADMFLGVPYNITSYALLLAGIADHVGLYTGKLKIVIGNAHIYENHVDAMTKMLANKDYKRPLFEARLMKSSEGWCIEALIEPYKSGPFIPAPVAV